MDEDRESPLAVVAKHQQRPPVDPDAIAYDLGIPVVRRPLGSNVSGMLVREGSRRAGFTIYLNAKEHPNRQRFTAAHELAHYILHRDLIEQGLTDDTMYRSELSNFYEVQANKMAANILMPVRLVKIWLARDPDIKSLAKAFGVSEGAMKIRTNSIQRLAETYSPAST